MKAKNKKLRLNKVQKNREEKPAEKVTIRQARPSDVARIVRLLKFQNKLKESAIPFDEDSASVWVMEILKNGMAAIAMFGDQCIGSVGFTVNRLPQNGAVHFLSQEWMYALPEYQKFDAELALMRRIKKMCGQKLVPISITLPEERQDMVEKYQEQYGFKPFSRTLVWDPESEKERNLWVTE